METEYGCSPSGPLISQTSARIADIPPSVVAVRRVASAILESRPISINLFSSKCLTHQCYSPGEYSASLGELVSSLVAVGNQAHMQEPLQVIVDRGGLKACGRLEVRESLLSRIEHFDHLDSVSVSQ